MIAKEQLPSNILNFDRAPLIQVQSIGPQKETAFSVKGLKCQACCARLKRHILDHGGVENCNVDFEKAEVTVRGTDLQESKLIGLIEQLGYTAHSKVGLDTKGLRQRQTVQRSGP